MVTQQGCENITRRLNLTLPDVSHVAGMGHVHVVKHPITISLYKLLSDFVVGLI